MDYEPLDLSPTCNAGTDIYAAGKNIPPNTWTFPTPEAPPVGAQRFHGLPFLIGGPEPSPDRCFVAPGWVPDPSLSPISIPVGKTARHLVFAHAVLETQLWHGGPVGQSVAQYRFCYADGQEVTADIRERFEVGNIPLPWGQFPFLCVPDQKDHVAERFVGRWDQVGFRQTEASKGAPLAYYLWVWKNPRPEAELATVELVPRRRKYVLAAITLGHLEEWPLVRGTRRPVRISFRDGSTSGGEAPLEVTVDRGVSTYPYPLPAGLPGGQIGGLPGFGAPFNSRGQPAMAEVAAIPSATVRVTQSGELLGEATWGELENGGPVEAGQVRLEIIDPGKNWVHVTVEDADTGRPVPCRVAFHSAEGVPYAPHGHHAPLFSNMHTWHIDVGGDVQLGQIAYAYIDGTCQGWLPRGKVLVDVARGFEYEPLRTWVDIEPSQRSLTLRLKRWIDMRAEGYYSGDTHVHFLSTQGSHTEAAGEDLDVVNLLLSQWGHLFTNSEDFTGEPSISARNQTIVYASQENRQHMLGHLTLLGLKKAVMPWGSGGPGEAELGGGLDITLSHWADACHAQGGTVVIPHLPTPNAEPAVLIATGRADAVEMLEHRAYEHLEYYRYLNAGYRLPLVGGTDKMSSNTPVGLYRTYVQIPEDQPFTYDSWCAGLRAGRTFLSGGALIWLSVDGQPPGSTISLKNGGTVEIEARARSIFPIHSLQIVQQGQVVAETSETDAVHDLHLRTSLKVAGDAWLAARAAGPNYYTATPHFDRRSRGVMAHTSPVYITSNKHYEVFDPQAMQYMETLVQGGLAYIRHNSPQHPAGQVTHHHGQDDHLAYLEAPFHEALEAIHHRMQQYGIAH